MKRCIKLADIQLLCIAEKSDEFLIRPKNEYDYRFRSDEYAPAPLNIFSKDLIVSVLERAFSQLSNSALPVFVMPIADLSPFQTTKKLLSKEKVPRQIPAKYQRNEQSKKESLDKSRLWHDRQKGILTDQSSVQCYRFFEEDAKNYFIGLEYVEGPSLREMLVYKKFFDESEVKFIAMQLTLALGYVHQQNIVFCDVNPDNVVVDKQGYLRLIDFNLSSVVSEGQ